MSVRLMTDRDSEMGRILARCCRALTARQLADRFFGGSLSGFDRSRQRLLRADWLQTWRVTVVPPPGRPQRLIHWQPGDRCPRLGPIAYQLRSLPPQPLRTMTIITSTRRCRLVWAGRCRVRRLDQLGHDLAVASVYLRYHRRHPRLARCWESEDQFSAERRRFEKQADARIAVPGRPRLLIEWATRSYDTPRLAGLHEQAARQGEAYEIWGDVLS